MNLMTKALKRRLGRVRSSRGSTLVEAAIITPLLLLLTFSIVDFAALLYIHMTL
jgi:Flp pilus assembly protein TadG